MIECCQNTKKYIPMLTEWAELYVRWKEFSAFEREECGCDQHLLIHYIREWGLI